jgi:hypothetical protein
MHAIEAVREGTVACDVKSGKHAAPPACPHQHMVGAHIVRTSNFHLLFSQVSLNGKFEAYFVK